MNRVRLTIVVALAGLVASAGGVSAADFLNFTVGDAITGVNSFVTVSDITGDLQNDGDQILTGDIGTLPLHTMASATTAMGVTGSSSSHLSYSANANHIDVQGLVHASVNTFGVQGSAEANAGAQVFFGFDLDEAAFVKIDWTLDDHPGNQNAGLGSINLFLGTINGPSLFGEQADPLGVDRSGLVPSLFLNPGHYVIGADASMLLSTSGPLSIAGDGGWNVSIDLVPEPASAMLLFVGAGAMVLRRRRAC